MIRSEVGMKAHDGLERQQLLGPNQLAILKVLERKQPMSYSELEQATGLKRKALYSAIVRLRALGLIDFELKGRSKLYYLTPAGKAATEGRIDTTCTGKAEKKVSIDILSKVLTSSDMAVLRVLLQGKSMTVAEIEKATGLRGLKAYYAVQRLMSFGFVGVERKDRLNFYYLTEEGKERAEEALKAVEARREAIRIVKGVFNKVVEATRLGVTLAEIMRELRLYELELKKRKPR
jgi:DNA-binding MarR family transcriptional regulator